MEAIPNIRNFYMNNLQVLVTWLLLLFGYETGRNMVLHIYRITSKSFELQLYMKMHECMFMLCMCVYIHIIPIHSIGIIIVAL